MASFYGGKPGIPFVIKKTFSSYNEMETAFAKGNDYKEVGYGEYVIINNNNPSDNKRGIVYKRGYNGPEEVGSFKGPQGTSMNFRGEYDPSATYFKNDMQVDIVFYNGSTYIRQGDSATIQGTTPSSSSNFWALFAQKGDQGEKGDPGEGGGTADVAQGLQQILLTNENLDNIKPDNFTCYYAEENNTVTSGPSSSSGGFSMLAYKVSQDRRVQEYVGAYGDRKIRYCSHSLTDENAIDDNGFNWGTNGKVLCKNFLGQSLYYACMRDNSNGAFLIFYSSNQIDARSGTSSGSFIRSDSYILDIETNTYTEYDSGGDYSNWYWIDGDPHYKSMTNFYSNQGNIPYLSNGYGYSRQYGTGEEIFDVDTGWDEWRTFGGDEGPQGPQGPAGKSCIASVTGNSDGTYTLVIRNEEDDNVTSPSP